MDRSDLRHVIVEQIAGETTSRRAFLLASAGSLAGYGLMIAGCASSGKTMADLPGPSWPGTDPQVPTPPGRQAPARPQAVIARSRWAQASPIPSRMNRMLPVRYITVHHTAGPTFTATDTQATAARLDGIRRYHRDNLGWGDIGYHFAVDRAGRVWECRPLSWQGAHVKDQNEGNVGVVAIGNFDEQSPSQAQLAGVSRQVDALMRRFRVPVSRVRTHQEWPTANTACPGYHLQRYMIQARKS